MPKKIDPSKLKRIDINQNSEIKYWCNKLNMSENQIRQAVETIGDSPDDVFYWNEIRKINKKINKN